MGFCILPVVLPGESLLGYLYRLAKVNKYDQLSPLFQLFGHPKRQLIKQSLFSKEFIERFSAFTFIPIHVLTGMCLNTLETRISDRTVLNKILLSKQVKYCPLCIKDQAHHKLIWSISLINICLEHQVELQDQCINCQKKILLGSLVKGECSCGQALSQVVVEKKLTDNNLSQQKLYDLILGDFEKVQYFGLSIKDIIKLIYQSFYLVDGYIHPTSGSKSAIKILFKRRKQLNGQVMAKAFEIIDWMYSSFPENFNKVLESFLNREQDSQKYWKKMKFEEIFSYKQFREIQTAYESYWIERLANGSRRRHLKMNFIQPVKLKADVGIVSTPLKRQFLFNEFMSNPENDVLLTYIETAQMVGLERRYVNQLVLSGLLKPLSKDGKRYLPKNDILELLTRCCGSITDDHIGRITIHEAILKYPGQGLSIVKIIILILEGKLIPKSQVQGTVLDTITLSIEEIDKIIIEFKKDRGVA